MNLWKKLTRLNISLVGVMTLISLISSSAHATLEDNSLFLLAIDPSRNATQASYALDLNFDFLQNDIASFSSITDSGLETWLGESSDLAAVTWGVFGAGKTNGLASEFRIVSTHNPVNPGDTPGTAGLTNIQGAIDDVQLYVQEFNSSALGADSVSATVADAAAGFPDGLTPALGGLGLVDFSAMGQFGASLEMYTFGIGQPPGQGFQGLPASLQAGGPWTLSELGQVSFGAAPVPVPPAFLLFIPALLSLFGARRKR